MSIKDRLRRLETGAGGCQECRRRPTKTYAIQPGEDDRAIPEPEYCPECGSDIKLVVLRLVYEDQRPEDLERDLLGEGGTT